MSAAIRVLVVDDESAARRRLLQLLAAEADVEVVGEARDGLQACALIAELAPDLLFLDVEMPELNGFGVVERIGVERMPATIFATAYDQYALAAFDAHALAYLLKPFDAERFGRALARARDWIGQGRLADCRAGMAAALALAPKAAHILLPCESGHKPVRLADILHISAKGNYVHIATGDGPFQLRETMTGILARLDPARFRRIHRSHIVNLDHVRKVLPWFGGDSLVMMADGVRLTLSRTHREALRDLA